MAHTVRALATDRELWKEYIDPSNQGGDDFDTMTIEEKMEMIVDLWPQDVDEDDEEGQEIYRRLRAKQAEKDKLGRPRYKNE